MTDVELRAIVRDAVARHLGRGASPPDPSGPLSDATVAEFRPPAAPAWGAHTSHAQYVTLINVGDACLIEPAVECTHCGYCKSHGH